MRYRPKRHHSEKPRERGSMMSDCVFALPTRRKTPGLIPPPAEKGRERPSMFASSSVVHSPISPRDKQPLGDLAGVGQPLRERHFTGQ